MIKKISKILNPKLINNSKIAYFKATGGRQQQEFIQSQNIQELKQQFQKKKGQQQTVEQAVIQASTQSAQAQNNQNSLKKRRKDQDQDIQLYQSNWEFSGKFINMQHTFKPKGQDYYNLVKERLDYFESFVNFNVQNLDRFKISQISQFQTKKSILKSLSDYRYLETDFEKGLSLEYSIISRQKLMGLIYQNDLTAIKKMFKNEQITNKSGLLYQDIIKIINIVIQSDFKSSFLLNLISSDEFVKNSRKNKNQIPKDLHKLWQRLDLQPDVNRLKMLWNVFHLFIFNNSQVKAQGIQNVIITQLSKIGFKGLDPIQTQIQIKTLFLTKIKNATINRILKYSLENVKQYQDFIKIWSLTILLFFKLYSFKGTNNTISSISLDAQLALFQNNLKEHYEQILYNIIPEQLNLANQKIMLQFYRQNIKNWKSQRGQQKKLAQKINNNIFANFTSQAFQSEKPIQIIYTGWINSFQQKTQSKLYWNSKINNQKYSTALSEQQMIKNLMKGEYSSVLNYFLFTFNASFDKMTYTQVKKIILQSKDYQFQNQNVKAYYILSKLNNLLSYQALPRSLQAKYLEKFKEIKWINNKTERQEKKRQDSSSSTKLFSDTKNKLSKPYFQEQQGQEKTTYRNKKQKSIYQNPVSVQKIQRKPKLFNRNKQHFSTSNVSNEKVTQKKDMYAQFRQTVKQITKETSTIQFSFQKLKDLKSIQQYAQKKSSQLNQYNYKFLLNQKDIPIVGSGSNILKYLFLKSKNQVTQSQKDFQKLKSKLKVSFVSQIGGLQKNYSQYLKECRFMFPLSNQIYVQLLLDQLTNYSRKQFKTIFSHMAAFKNTLSDDQVTLICEVCRKNKTGITLVQMYYILINNKIQISAQSIYKICETLQRFKGINNDVFPLTKKYCENLKIPFKIKMMTSYCRNLLLSQQDQPKLIEFCQILKEELRPKAYKVRTDLNAQQNLKLQKQYKEASKVEYGKILFNIIQMVVQNVHKKVPIFVTELFDQYQKLKLSLQPHQIAISLMVYSGKVQKFLQIIAFLRQNPDKIIIDSYIWGIKAFTLYPRQYEQHMQNAFDILLFTHNFTLSEEQVLKSSQLFKLLKSTAIFSKFLNFVIRYNIPVNFQIKNSFYWTMNNSHDDFSKSSINQLLDLIFNNNREKEKQLFRLEKIQQEQKTKLIENIQTQQRKDESKQISTDKQKKQTTVDQKKSSSIKTNLKETKTTTTTNAISGQTEKTQPQKQGKKLEAKSKKQIAKQKAKEAKTNDKKQKKGSRQERRKLLSQTKQGIVIEKNEQINQMLKPNTLPKKLQSRSLTYFTDLYGSRDPMQQAPTTTKTGKGKPGASSKKQEQSQKEGKGKGKFNPSKANKKK